MKAPSSTKGASRSVHYPNGRTNADVLKPWVNGMDLTRRPAGKWIVDFGWAMSAGDAALYEEPFWWVRERVYPMRQQNRGRACGECSTACRATSPRRGLRSTGCSAGTTRASAPTRN